jgi:hypothetical protein
VLADNEEAPGIRAARGILKPLSTIHWKPLSIIHWQRFRLRTTGRMETMEFTLGDYLAANGHRFRSETGAADQVEAAVKPEPDPEQLDALVAELRVVVTELRTDRDAWRDQAQQLAQPAPQPPRQRWRWFQRAS